MAQQHESAAAITAQLRQKYHINLKHEWVSNCLQALGTCHADFQSWPSQRRIDAVFAQALCSDMTTTAEACLPQALQAMHKQPLQGKYVLQIEEVVNMAASAKDRYTNTNDRCLKLHLTDGVQHITAMEYRPLPSLHWDCPAGCKLLVENVMVRRGVLLLQPENCAVLGGKVEALEAARKCAVACWNKPAEGRSRHEGPRDIFNEARAAAWDVTVIADDVARQPDQQPTRSDVQPQQPQRFAQAGMQGQLSHNHNAPSAYNSAENPMHTRTNRTGNQQQQQQQQQGLGMQNAYQAQTQQQQQQQQQAPVPAAGSHPYPAFNLPSVSARPQLLPNQNIDVGSGARPQPGVLLQPQSMARTTEVTCVDLCGEEQGIGYDRSGPGQGQYAAAGQPPPPTHLQQQQQQQPQVQQSYQQQHSSSRVHVMDTRITAQQQQYGNQQHPQQTYQTPIQRETSGVAPNSTRDGFALPSVQRYNGSSSVQQQQQPPTASFQGNLPPLQEVSNMQGGPGANFSFDTQTTSVADRQRSVYDGAYNTQQRLPPSLVQQSSYHANGTVQGNQGGNQRQQQPVQTATMSHLHSRGLQQCIETSHFTPPIIRPIEPSSTHTAMHSTALTTVVAARGYAAFAHRSLQSPVPQSTPQQHTVPETPADRNVGQLQHEDADDAYLWHVAEEMMVDGALQTTPAVSRQPQHVDLTVLATPVMVPSSPETLGGIQTINHGDLAMNSTVSDSFYVNQPPSMVQQQPRPATTAVSRPLQSPVMIDLCDEDDDPESTRKPGMDVPASSQQSFDAETPCETKAISATGLQHHERHVWAETSISYICQLPMACHSGLHLQQQHSLGVQVATGDHLEQVIVLGTFHSSEGDVVTLEDGTGLLQAIMSEQLLQTIFQGFTIQDLMTEHADPELQAQLREVAAYGEQLLRTFHGLILLQLPPTLPPGQERATLRPVVLGLRTLETAEEWQEALDKLLP